MCVAYFIEFEDFMWKFKKKIIHEYSSFPPENLFFEKKIVENFNISTNNLISVEAAEEGTRVLYCSSIVDVGTYNHVGD
jgi:hypothetical protein